MKICVAQTRPIKGDVQRNTEAHFLLIDRAAAQGADMIVFPELSITGYEPTLAKSLATDVNDVRFNPFQEISNALNMIICIGVPVKAGHTISIGMIVFQPNKPRAVYSKSYLHPDEDPFFTGAKGISGLTIKKMRLAFAICYEISVPAHAALANQDGARIYIASVAKSVEGVDKAANRLSQIANEYSMTVLMSNFIGHCDNFDCGGKSSVWNAKGELIAQLDDHREGILVFDTETQAVIKKVI
jgi:predicted amidohydrolase